MFGAESTGVLFVAPWREVRSDTRTQRVSTRRGGEQKQHTPEYVVFASPREGELYTQLWRSGRRAFGAESENVLFVAS